MRHALIALLQQTISEDIRTAHGCRVLSASIERKTRSHLSPNTLKRLTGVLKGYEGSEIRLNSENRYILAKYLGFRDVEELNTRLADMKTDATAEPLTIISALDRIQQEAQGSGMSEDFMEDCRHCFSFLNEKLNLSEIQALVLAIMCETGEPMAWRNLANYLGVSRLSLMNHSAELEQLVDRRWLLRRGVSSSRGLADGFALPYGIIKAFRNGKPFKPENLENLTEQQFIDRMLRYMRNEGAARGIALDENQRFLLQLCRLNHQLPLCQEIFNLDEDYQRLGLLAIIADYFNMPYYAGNPGAGENDWDDWLDDDYETEVFSNEMKNGVGPLFTRGVVEHPCADGLLDNSRVRLTEDAIKRLLGDAVPHAPKQDKSTGVIQPSEIIEKTMLYNPAEEVGVRRLEHLFSEERLADVRRRLRESGMRSGITCLFYGAPGTGKTETALQLARLTGHPVMQVDIAGMRDKFVGESEKNIKAVFDNYRRLCKGDGPMPILLFNEADALIHSRFESPASSVERMDNAMQNIILQEMETLDGILIATTNLSGTLDRAIERRFLFKVEFTLPEAPVREKLWKSMLPDISAMDCAAIARETELSGGQIENVARKCKIEYALTGHPVQLPQLRDFCREERLRRVSSRPVGFQ